MAGTKNFARRTVLIGSAAVVGGVVFGAYYLTKPIPNPLLDDLEDGEAAITPFIKITRDGITLITPRADVGQGIMSTQAYLIAEELDIDPHTAALDPGQPHAAYFNGAIIAESVPFAGYDEGFVPETVRDLIVLVARTTGAQFTGGSSSVSDLHEKLRMAGAVARETLKEAAARRERVSAETLKTENGGVIFPDGKRLPYTELAVDAAEIKPVKKVDLRSPDEWKWLRKPYLRTDIIAKSTGAQRYGIDMRMDGMLHATVRLNPGRGGGLLRFDARRAEQMQGVKKVAPITGGIGVIADNTWRAFKAAQAVSVEWGAPDYPATSEEMWDEYDRAHKEEKPDSRLRNDGKPDAILKKADDIIEAEYRTPYLAHAALEPLSATVLVQEGQVDIWTATQIPSTIRDHAAKIAGVKSDKVKIHVLPAGGSFGRRLDHDYAMRAVEIAMHMPGVPIKTTYSRDEDTTQDFPRAMHMARARGVVKDGKVECFDLDSICQSTTLSWFARVLAVPPGPDTITVWGAFDQPFSIPHYRVTGYHAREMVPIGSWRSPGACSNSFFHECFFDELAKAAGADPLEERLRLIDHETSRGVLEAVGEMSNWSGVDIGEGRGRGVAFCYSHGVPAAEVVDVTITEKGVRVDDIWVAIDPGLLLDPINAESQIFGGVIWALGHAINSELTYENYAPRQTNYHAFEGLRYYQTPNIHTRFLENGERIRGLGEPSVPPVAPALANAIFAATGQRLREMPFHNFMKFV